MMPGEDRRPQANHPAAAARASRGPSFEDVRETSGQVIRGLFRLGVIILAAFLGAMAVEAARAIF